MSLPRSAWKYRSPGCPNDDYIQVFPEAGFIITYSSSPQQSDKTIIWGLWIREDSDSLVFTAHKNAKLWRKESYKIEGGQLFWNNGNGHGDAVWDSIEDSTIPNHLQLLGSAFIEKFTSLIPPEFKLAEQQAGSSNGG
jgi:hypothetical protein